VLLLSQSACSALVLALDCTTQLCLTLLLLLLLFMAAWHRLCTAPLPVLLPPLPSPFPL
jgi:hypothetical protein